jgi:hypothetical protein
VIGSTECLDCLVATVSSQSTEILSPSSM